jgi:hypothetical protein
MPERVRITADLVSAKTGHHLRWEPYDVALADIFDVQKSMEEQIAAFIEPELTRLERSCWSLRPLRLRRSCSRSVCWCRTQSSMSGGCIDATSKTSGYANCSDQAHPGIMTAAAVTPQVTNTHSALGIQLGLTQLQCSDARCAEAGTKSGRNAICSQIAWRQPQVGGGSGHPCGQSSLALP